MRMKFTPFMTSLVTILLAFAATSSAFSHTLHSNEFTDNTKYKVVWFIVDTFKQVVGDDFQIDSADATVTDIQFWITIGAPSAPPTGFFIQFYESVLPSETKPGKLIQEITTSDFTIKKTEFIQIFAPVYEVNLTLPPGSEFNAAKGVRYWISFGAIAASKDDYRVALALDAVVIGHQANVHILNPARWVSTQHASGNTYGPADAFFSLYGNLENSLEMHTWGGVKSSF